MNTEKNTSDNLVPTFMKKEAYNFVEDKVSFEIYRELSQIAEEIEKCRKKNC